MVCSYENDVSDSYLIIESENHNDAFNFQINMLRSNEIERVAKIEVKRQNDNVFYYYKITSKVSLELFLKRKKLKKHECLKILWDISDILLSCGGFLLSTNCFVLETDYIYINPESLDMQMIYFPSSNMSDTGILFREFIIDLILRKVYIDDCEGDNFLQRILNFVREDIFNISAFYNLIESMRYENTNVTEDAYCESALSHPVVSENKTIKKQKGLFNILSRNKGSKENSQNIDFENEKTKIKESYNNTTLLGIINDTKCVLVSVNSEYKDEVEIDKPEFLIGRLSDQVDLKCNNSAVGKIHAEIINRNGLYYLKDLNSINGTFLNNIRIESNKEFKIENNDTISFANSQYLFRIK